MKLLFTILITYSSSFLSVFYEHFNKPLVNINYHLAITINSGINSGYINYAIVGETNGNLMYTKFITSNEFILIGMGKQVSAANDIGINIFRF